MAKLPKPLKTVNGGKAEIAQEPKVVFKFVIESLDNGTSRHMIPQGVPLEIMRDILFRHMMLIEEQITMFKIEQKQNQVKILKPGQLPPGMKLHS